MLRNIKNILTLALPLLLAACSKEVRTEDPGMEIRFNVTYPALTRATSTGFESGDTVGLWMTEYVSGAASPLRISGNAVNNAALICDGSSWKTSPTVYWNRGVKYDVYGYYPYDPSPASADEYRFSVATDQSAVPADGSLGGYEASDFLWAKTTGVKYPDAVTLSFSHKMSRVVVNLVKGSGYEGEFPDDLAVTVHSVAVDAIVDLGSGDVVKDPKGRTGSVKLRKEGDGRYAGIVVPQRLDDRKPLVEVAAGDVSYLLESRFVFRSGMQHSITVTLNSDPDKVSIEIGGTVVDWN
jgi:hypothetical protein